MSAEGAHRVAAATIVYQSAHAKWGGSVEPRRSAEDASWAAGLEGVLREVMASIPLGRRPGASRQWPRVCRQSLVNTHSGDGDATHGARRHDAIAPGEVRRKADPCSAVRGLRLPPSSQALAKFRRGMCEDRERRVALARRPYLFDNGLAVDFQRRRRRTHCRRELRRR